MIQKSSLASETADAENRTLPMSGIGAHLKGEGKNVLLQWMTSIEGKILVHESYIWINSDLLNIHVNAYI